MRGLFVVIEGIDGSGKTSVAREIVERLPRLGLEAIYTYEPYESPFSEALRRLKERGPTSPVLDTLAMFCDRAYHVDSVIEPALSRGVSVVADRYYYSTIAYQGAMGADVEWIRGISRVFRKPDLAIYLDVEPEVGLSRSSGTRWRHYEDLEILRRARKIYMDLVALGELVLVDSMQPLGVVIERTWRLVAEKLPLPGRPGASRS